jgi:hypothetical protein
MPRAQRLKPEEVRLSRSFYLPLPLYAELRRVSEERKVPMSKIVEEALRLYLEARPFFSDRRVLEALRALASKSGTSGELERLARALAEALREEKEVESGG